MIESVKHVGIFDVFDHNLPPDELRWLLRRDSVSDLWERGYFEKKERFHNTVTAQAKLLMANAIYPSIASLIITSQTSTPGEGETSYSGVIYTSTAGDEVMRSGNTNPYQVGWNIFSNSANGTWGSFVTITAAGFMVNRALAGVTKASGQSKLVIFTGSVR